MLRPSHLRIPFGGLLNHTEPLTSWPTRVPSSERFQDFFCVETCSPKKKYPVTCFLVKKMMLMSNSIIFRVFRNEYHYMLHFSSNECSPNVTRLWLKTCRFSSLGIWSNCTSKTWKRPSPRSRQSLGGIFTTREKALFLFNEDYCLFVCLSCKLHHSSCWTFTWF